MPIPSLSAAGVLPAGVHDATLVEVGERFGTSSERRVELFDGLSRLIERVSPSKHFASIVVDGSFVTDKLSPGDVDCVLLTTNGVTFFADPAMAEIRNSKAMKDQYGVHLFFEPIAASNMVSFFQSMRPAEGLARGLQPTDRRGVVKVAL